MAKTPDTVWNVSLRDNRQLAFLSRWIYMDYDFIGFYNSGGPGILKEIARIPRASINRVEAGGKLVWDELANSQPERTTIDG